MLVCPSLRDSGLKGKKRSYFSVFRCRHVLPSLLKRRNELNWPPPTAHPINLSSPFSITPNNSTTSVERSSTGSRRSTRTWPPSSRQRPRGRPPRRSPATEAPRQRLTAKSTATATTTSTSARLLRTTSPTTCAPTWRSWQRWRS